MEADGICLDGKSELNATPAMEAGEKETVGQQHQATMNTIEERKISFGRILDPQASEKALMELYLKESIRFATGEINEKQEKPQKESRSENVDNSDFMTINTIPCEDSKELDTEVSMEKRDGSLSNNQNLIKFCDDLVAPVGCTNRGDELTGSGKCEKSYEYNTRDELEVDEYLTSKPQQSFATIEDQLSYNMIEKTTNDFDRVFDKLKSVLEIEAEEAFGQQTSLSAEYTSPSSSYNLSDSAFMELYLQESAMFADGDKAEQEEKKIRESTPVASVSNTSWVGSKNIGDSNETGTADSNEGNIGNSNEESVKNSSEGTLDSKEEIFKNSNEDGLAHCDEERIEHSNEIIEACSEKCFRNSYEPQTEGWNNESVEGLKEENAEGSTEEFIEGSKEEIVEGLKKECIKGSEEECIEGLKGEIIKGLKKESVDGSKEQSVESSKEQSVEILEEENVESSKEECIEGSEEKSVENSKEESNEGSKEESIKGSKEKIVEGLKNENFGSSKEENIINCNNGTTEKYNEIDEDSKPTEIDASNNQSFRISVDSAADSNKTVINNDEIIEVCNPEKIAACNENSCRICVESIDNSNKNSIINHNEIVEDSTPDKIDASNDEPSFGISIESPEYSDDKQSIKDSQHENTKACNEISIGNSTELIDDPKEECLEEYKHTYICDCIGESFGNFVETSADINNKESIIKYNDKIIEHSEPENIDASKEQNFGITTKYIEDCKTEKVDACKEQSFGISVVSTENSNEEGMANYNGKIIEHSKYDNIDASKCDNTKGSKYENIEDSKCESTDDSIYENIDALNCDNSKGSKSENIEGPQCENIEDSTCENIEGSKCENNEDFECENIESSTDNSVGMSTEKFDSRIAENSTNYIEKSIENSKRELVESTEKTVGVSTEQIDDRNFDSIINYNDKDIQEFKHESSAAPNEQISGININSINDSNERKIITFNEETIEKIQDFNVGNNGVSKDGYIEDTCDKGIEKFVLGNVDVDEKKSIVDSKSVLVKETKSASDNTLLPSVFTNEATEVGTRAEFQENYFKNIHYEVCECYKTKSESGKKTEEELTNFFEEDIICCNNSSELLLQAIEAVAAIETAISQHSFLTVKETDSKPLFEVVEGQPEMALTDLYSQAPSIFATEDETENEEQINNKKESVAGVSYKPCVEFERNEIIARGEFVNDHNEAAPNSILPSSAVRVEDRARIVQGHCHDNDYPAVSETLQSETEKELPDVEAICYDDKNYVDEVTTTVVLEIKTGETLEDETFFTVEAPSDDESFELVHDQSERVNLERYLQEAMLSAAILKAEKEEQSYYKRTFEANNDCVPWFESIRFPSARFIDGHQGISIEECEDSSYDENDAELNDDSLLIGDKIEDQCASEDYQEIGFESRTNNGDSDTEQNLVEEQQLEMNYDDEFDLLMDMEESYEVGVEHGFGVDTEEGYVDVDTEESSDDENKFNELKAVLEIEADASVGQFPICNVEETFSNSSLKLNEELSETDFLDLYMKESTRLQTEEDNEQFNGNRPDVSIPNFASMPWCQLENQEVGYAENVNLSEEMGVYSIDGDDDSMDEENEIESGDIFLSSMQIEEDCEIYQNNCSENVASSEYDEYGTESEEEAEEELPFLMDEAAVCYETELYDGELKAVLESEANETVGQLPVLSSEDSCSNSEFQIGEELSETTFMERYLKESTRFAAGDKAEKEEEIQKGIKPQIFSPYRYRFGLQNIGDFEETLNTEETYDFESDDSMDFENVTSAEATNVEVLNSAQEVNTDSKEQCRKFDFGFEFDTTKLDVHDLTKNNLQTDNFTVSVNQPHESHLHYLSTAEVFPGSESDQRVEADEKLRMTDVVGSMENMVDGLINEAANLYVDMYGPKREKSNLILPKEEICEVVAGLEPENFNTDVTTLADEESNKLIDCKRSPKLQSQGSVSRGNVRLSESFSSLMRKSIATPLKPSRQMLTRSRTTCTSALSDSLEEQHQLYSGFPSSRTAITMNRSFSNSQQSPQLPCTKIEIHDPNLIFEDIPSQGELGARINENVEYDLDIKYKDYTKYPSESAIHEMSKEKYLPTLSENKEEVKMAEQLERNGNETHQGHKGIVSRFCRYMYNSFSSFFGRKPHLDEH